MMEPNLDRTSFEELQRELVAAIPRYSTNWTDYNASDPGITILELLAWVSETLLYRMNQLTDASYLNFLQLTAGAAGDEVALLLQDLREQRIDDPNKDGTPLYIDPDYIGLLEFLEAEQLGFRRHSIPEIQQAALRFWSWRFRAITRADYETLAIQATAPLKEDAKKVARAIARGAASEIALIIVSGAPNTYTKAFPKSDEAYIVSARREPNKDEEKDYEVLTQQVAAFLEPRQLVGTHLSVSKAVFTSTYLRITVVDKPGVSRPSLALQIIDTLTTFLDPLQGGLDGAGWPYGRPLSTNDLYPLIENTGGVSYVKTLQVSTGQFRVGLFSTLNVDSRLGPLPVRNTYSVDGLVRLEYLILTIENQ